ncbi:MAG: hypothetical protein IKV40_04945 [Clostridia bacterium]|nr:hypothetical protein [Clostridia bacterium]MBR5632578.1 hypothetical protein [Clostridia bacterium]
MDNRSTPTTPANGADGKRGASKKYFAKQAILILASSAVFCSLKAKAPFWFITACAVVVGMLAFFIKEKAYGALLTPAIFSLGCHPHYMFSIPALLFMILLAFLCVSFLKERPGQFVFFTMCAMMYSIAAVTGGGLVAVQYYGSVKACLEAITVNMTSSINLFFDNIPEALMAKVSAESLASAREMYLTVAEQVVFLIPAFLVTAAMYAAFITKRTLTAALGGKRMLPVLFSTPYYPPVLLAVIYMILSFVGVFFALGSEQAYYIYANLSSVLGIIFAYVGAVEYISVIRHPVRPKQRVVYIILGLVVIGLLAQSAVAVLAYYGAYRTVFSRVRVIRITKQ